MLCGISASCDVCKLWICTVQVRAVLGWAGLGWRWRSGEYELWDVSCLMLGILCSWVDHFSVVSVDLVGCCHDMSALYFVKRMRLEMTKWSQVFICREARRTIVMKEGWRH